MLFLLKKLPPHPSPHLLFPVHASSNRIPREILDTQGLGFSDHISAKTELYPVADFMTTTKDSLDWGDLYFLCTHFHTSRLHLYPFGSHLVEGWLCIQIPITSDPDQAPAFCRITQLC